MKELGLTVAQTAPASGPQDQVKEDEEDEDEQDTPQSKAA
jgi:hypothetical protein